MKFYLLTLCTIVLLPALCYSERSRATYYGSPYCKGTPTGACGFGEYGRNVNDGQVSGVSRLFRGGSGCGACYQVKCTIPELCTEEGTKVLVTDYGEGDRTDFILSTAAYAKLARPFKAEKLFPYGVVAVEFKRVPCNHKNNLVFKILEQSKFPGYLAIVPLYQPGTFDIIGMEVYQADSNEWRPMRRAYGTVFDIKDPPLGVLSFRYDALYVSGGSTVSVQLNNVIPSDWKTGYMYDTGISA